MEQINEADYTERLKTRLYYAEKRKLMLSKVLLTLKKALDDELQAFKKFVNNGLDIAED